jgi:CubicO group peptidase (beta-lactamase class C family)
MRALIVLVLCVPGIAVAGVDPAKVDAAMARWVKKDGPGCAVAVVEAGKVTHAKGYGMADLERRVPIGAETVFDIGSTSKQFTAAAVLLLAADGKLGLDDDVRKWVPEVPQVGKGKVTVRHLLHHTGGVRDYIGLLTLAGFRDDDVTTVRDALAALARQKGVEFEPGARHEYSNTGYFLLAQIAQRASGKAMAGLVGERIFKPLGMAKSLVNDDRRRLVADRALGYAPRSAGGWRLNVSAWEQTGDGAVLTTVQDLAKWDANFYTPSVGGKALVDGLLRRGRLADGTELDYAAGLEHGEHNGRKYVHHGGSWAGFRAQLVRFPAQRTSVIALCNAGPAIDADDVAYGVADLVLDGTLEPAPAAPPAVKAVAVSGAVLDAWVGTWADRNENIFVIRRSGDRLVLLENGEARPLVTTGERTAVVEGGDGSVLERDATARTITVAKTTFSPVAPHKATAAELAALAGRYASTEVDTVWTLAVDRGALTLTGRGIDDGAVVFTKPDELYLVGLGLTVGIARTGAKVTSLGVGWGDDMQFRFDRL